MSDSSKKTPKISVVLSFRNEEDVLEKYIDATKPALEAAKVDYEFIFVDDDSSDRSGEILHRLAQDDSRIKVVTMSRRFGTGECVFAGFAHGSGDAFIYMDCDLQDPPELIPEMVAKWRAGAEVVYTVRTQRHGESAAKMWLTAQAYKAINKISEIDMPINAGDYRLIDRKVRDQILKFDEKEPYIRGLTRWVGFKQEPLYYERQERAAGVTHFPLLRSMGPWKTLFTGLTSFSVAPVFVVFLLGAFLSMLATVGLIAALAVDGFGTAALIAFLSLIWGTLMLSAGIVGVYVVRIFRDVRGRPLYIVRDTVNLPDSKS